MWGRGWGPLFLIWIFNFSSTINWGYFPFSIEFLWHFNQKIIWLYICGSISGLPIWFVGLFDYPSSNSTLSWLQFWFGFFWSEKCHYFAFISWRDRIMIELFLLEIELCLQSFFSFSTLKCHSISTASKILMQNYQILLLLLWKYICVLILRLLFAS